MDTLKNVLEAFAYKNKLAFYRYVSGMNDLWILSTGLADGINTISASAGLSMYPNPAHDYITVKMERNINKPVDLIISNIHGQVVKKWRYADVNRFSVSDLLKGTYSLSADKADKRVSLKFIKY